MKHLLVLMVVAFLFACSPASLMASPMVVINFSGTILDPGNYGLGGTAVSGDPFSGVLAFDPAYSDRYPCIDDPNSPYGETCFHGLSASVGGERYTVFQPLSGFSYTPGVSVRAWGEDPIWVISVNLTAMDTGYWSGTFQINGSSHLPPDARPVIGEVHTSSPVPEPSTIFLLALGSTLLLRNRSSPNRLSTQQF